MKENKSNIKKSKTKGIALSYIYFIFNTIISVLVSAFIARSVGKTDYGVYQTMTAFITYLVLLEFGMSTLMTRNISLIKKNTDSKSEIDKNVSTIWSTTLILSAIIIIFLFVFFFSIPYIYSKSFSLVQIFLGKKIFIFAGLNLVFNFLCSTLNGLVLAYEEYSFEKYINLIKLFIRTIFIVIALSIKPNIVLVVIVDFILGLLSFIFTYIYCAFKFKAKLNFKYFDKTIIKLCLPLALAMFIQAIVNVANTVVDKFLIGIMMSPEDVSIYSVTMLIFTMFSSLGTLPNTLFIPSIANSVNKKIEGFEFTKTLVQPCRLNVLITGFVATLYILVGRQFIIIAYGKDYIEAWYYSLVLIIPLFFYLTDAIMAHVLTLYNKRQIMSYVSLIATAINIILTVIVINYFGAMGAALATSISIVIQIICLNYYYKKKLKINVFYLFIQSYKGIVASFLLSFVFVYPILNRIQNIYIQLIVCSVLFFFLFFVIYFSIGSNKEEIKLIKQQIFKKRKEKELP